MAHMTILTSVMQFAMMPLQGLGQGAQPIMSYNYGAESRNRVKEDIYIAFEIQSDLFLNPLALYYAVPSDFCLSVYL